MSIVELIAKSLTYPSLTSEALRRVIQYLRIGSPKFRYFAGAHKRPAYAFLVYEAASLAYKLGYPEISICEFGVGGGGGLLDLEENIRWVEQIFPVHISLYGFDNGKGLPPSKDYRDLPYVWTEGQFKLDPAELAKQLDLAKLIIGDVKETVPDFISGTYPPIAAIAFDLDYFSSTVSALKIFDAKPSSFLPRLPLYFDDTLGSMLEMHIDEIGERAAIKQFNESRQNVKIGQANVLVSSNFRQRWHHQIYFAHLFSHMDYAKPIV